MPRRCSASPTSAISPAARPMPSASTPTADKAASMRSSRPVSATPASGVPYQVQYAFKRGDDENIWLEDTGRWFAGPDGKPLRAHGIVRVDQRASRTRAQARATREVRSADRRTEPRPLDRGARRHARRGGEIPRLVRLPAGRHRPSRPAQRSLRLRHHRGRDRAGRQAHPRAPARQGSSRPLLRQQIRRGADQLHARRIGGCRRSPADRRARRDDRRPPPARWR